MTVFEGPMATRVRLLGDQERTPKASAGQVGWVAALVWPTVWTAVVAGALLGSQGSVLLWAGIVGVVAMAVRQAMKFIARNVHQAGVVIDNAPGGKYDA